MKFAIYYAEREFAHHHSDPRLALIDAPSREEAEPVGKVYRFLDYTSAEALARRMARDRGLEFIHEASHA